MRFALPLLLTLCAAPAFAETQVWECKIEQRIEHSRSTAYTEAQRAQPNLRLDFAVDPAANKGCLLTPGADTCATAFNGAGEQNGVLRLDARHDNTLDLVNIFPSTGRFIRIHGDVQWTGKAGDCVRVRNRTVRLP
jgi:hypothetical protein